MTQINIQPGGQYVNPNILTVTAGNTLVLNSLGAPLTPAYGVFVNQGDVWVSGTLDVKANLVQTGNNGNSTIYIINGGHVLLDGSADGGDIAVNSGMLEFAKAPQFIGPTTATAYHSQLAFGGTDGVVKFDGVRGALSVNYNPTTQDLVVSTRYGQVADFHLVGGPQPYNAAEFTVKGDELLYHFIKTQ